MIELTPREKEAIQAIKKFNRQNLGLSPSVQELADIIGVSKTRAAQYINALIVKGKVKRIGTAARSIVLVP